MRCCRGFIVLIAVVVIIAAMALFAGCMSHENSGSTVTESVTATTAGNAGDELRYMVVGTGQVECFNNLDVITCPGKGQAFYGQDAQYTANEPSYKGSSDGLTVYDKNTELTWQKSPDITGDGTITADDKLTFQEALEYADRLNAENFGGYDDWRLPEIKELYSLIEFSGTDPSGYEGTDTSGLKPFIDTDYFDFAYGDTDAGERIIDSQYASDTLYVADENKLFGVNFADGRIKGYYLVLPEAGAGDLLSSTGSDEIAGAPLIGVKTFFVICVRGNPEYGMNSLTDNGDGTITDSSTSLMWSKSDSGSGMNWEDALAWVQEKNTENYLGYSDWRLPDIKELQSIVDYSRSPETSDSAAISPLFECTQIINEAGQADYPYFWSSTTHKSWNGKGSSAAYVAFGSAPGYMNGRWVDVHGAGAQRSDPKSGSAAEYPEGHGPQGDAIRIDNFVRLVRG